MWQHSNLMENEGAELLRVYELKHKNQWKKKYRNNSTGN
jgi:hypothetical protein